jgi:hypothetical protein
MQFDRNKDRTEAIREARNFCLGENYSQNEESAIAFGRNPRDTNSERVII